MSREADIVRRFLGSDRVKEVRVISDVNVDGERIVRVFIVYDSSRGELTVEEMSSVTSELWTSNLVQGETAFPVPSFISSDDEKVLGAA